MNDATPAHEYAAGEWTAVAADGLLALVAPGARPDVAAGLWEVAGEGGDVLSALGVVAAAGFAELPQFAIVTTQRPGAVRAVLRGPVELRVRTAAGEQVLAAREDAVWTEHRAEGVESLELRAGDGGTTGTPWWPLLGGVVRAVAVRRGRGAGTEDDAEEGHRAADAAAGSYAAATHPADAPEAEAVRPAPAGEPTAVKHPTPAEAAPAEPEPVPAGDAEPAAEPQPAAGPGPAPSHEPSPGPSPEEAALPSLPVADLPPAPDLPTPPDRPTVPDLPPPPAAPVAPAAVAPTASALDPLPAGDGTDALGLPVASHATADEPDVHDTVLEDGWWRSAPTATPDVPPAPPAPAESPAALHAAPASSDPWAAPPPSPVATQEPLDPSDDDHDGMTILSSDLARLRDRLPAWTHDAVPGPFPTPEPTPLPARLVLSTGVVVELDRAVLLGRAPQVSRVTAKELPRLVTVPSPNQDISRTHAEVRLEGDHVVVTDLDSTNGVHVSRPGEGVRRLPAGEPSVVATDEVVDLGDGVTFTVERTA